MRPTEKTSPQKRRAGYTRLIGYFLALVAGASYLLYPPFTSFNQFETNLPARMLGGFILIGSAVCIFAWASRMLILIRLGLTLLIIGTSALTLNQMYMVFVGPTLTRIGGSIILCTLVAFLIAREQEVRHEELLAEESLNHTFKK